MLMTVGANHLVENVNVRNENIFITQVTYTVILQCKCFNYSNLYISINNKMSDDMIL